MVKVPFKIKGIDYKLLGNKVKSFFKVSVQKSSQGREKERLVAR